MSEWVCINDVTPPVGEPLLVAALNKNGSIVYFGKYVGFANNTHVLQIAEQIEADLVVTHYMVIPTLPAIHNTNLAGNA